MVRYKIAFIIGKKYREKEFSDLTELVRWCMDHSDEIALLYVEEVSGGAEG